MSIVIPVQTLNITFDKRKLFEHIDLKVFERYILHNDWRVSLDRNGTKIYSHTQDCFNVVIVHNETTELPNYILSHTFSDNIKAICAATGKSEYSVVTEILKEHGLELGLQ